MKIPSNCFKAFLECEDVFYGDLEKHKKHFLPICSISLKFLAPENDQWFHFVSVKEIYDGQVWQNTKEYHTTFCKSDMLLWMINTNLRQIGDILKSNKKMIFRKKSNKKKRIFTKI